MTMRASHTRETSGRIIVGARVPIPVSGWSSLAPSPLWQTSATIAKGVELWALSKITRVTKQTSRIVEAARPSRIRNWEGVECFRLWRREWSLSEEGGRHHSNG